LELTCNGNFRCFYINLPIGGLAAFVILLTFKTPATATRVDATLKEKLLQMDFPGTALIMGASLALLLALQYGGVTHTWNSSVVVGLLVGFGVMVLALVILEIWQGERAMLTPRLVRQRTVWVNAIWGFFFAGAYFITLYYLPIYFQSIDNRSPIGSGVRNIPLIACFSFATFASGIAITKTGVAAQYLVASSVVVTISAGLLYTLDIGTSTGKCIGYQILAGFGYGMGLQIPVIIAQAFAAPSDIAPVTAIIICKFSYLLSQDVANILLPSFPKLIVSLVHSRSIYRRNILDRSRTIRLRQSARAQACQHLTKRRYRPSHCYRCHNPAPGILWSRAGRCSLCVRTGYQGRFCNYYRGLRYQYCYQLVHQVGQY
jgi:hypothetical protein